jgi:hypothetical protein
VFDLGTVPLDRLIAIQAAAVKASKVPGGKVTAWVLYRRQTQVEWYMTVSSPTGSASVLLTRTGTPLSVL